MVSRPVFVSLKFYSVSVHGKEPLPKAPPLPAPPPPPPSFTMSYDCHYDSDEHCGMWCLYYDWQMSVVICDVYIVIVIVPMIGRLALCWCSYFDCHCDCPHDWQLSAVICPYYDCLCDCPHDWQVSTVIWCPYYDCYVPIIDRWVALWFDVHSMSVIVSCPHDWQLSTVICPYYDCHCDWPWWLTNEHLPLTWCPVIVIMIDRWALWYDVHIMIVVVICPHDWQVSTVIWCP